MKRCLAVINTGKKNHIHPKSRESFLHAAKRWGADFVEIKDSPYLTNLVSDHPFRSRPEIPCHVYWQKTFVIDSKFVEDYDQVLQLDADMLIRSDCPSPFEQVEPNCLGVVSAHQYLRNQWIQGRDKSVRFWARKLKLKPCADEHHINGGFFLYSTEHHRELFRRWQQVGYQNRFRSSFLPEQASLSVLCRNLGKLKLDEPVGVKYLPHAFNTVGAQQMERHNKLGRFMKAFIYHYTGGNKHARTENTWWNVSHPKPKSTHRASAILKRLDLTKPVVGVEVGVLRGNNAYYLLSQHPQMHLNLVDLWAAHPIGGSYRKSKDGNAYWENDDFKMMLHETLDRLEEFYGRFSIVQKPSISASGAFQDASLDFVFIDANHSFEGVTSDLAHWWDKVKPGGWIGGHDYAHSKTSWGVKKAVDSFFHSLRKVERDVNLTWFVTR